MDRSLRDRRDGTGPAGGPRTRALEQSRGRGEPVGRTQSSSGRTDTPEEARGKRAADTPQSVDLPPRRAVLADLSYCASLGDNLKPAPDISAEIVKRLVQRVPAGHEYRLNPGGKQILARPISLADTAPSSISGHCPPNLPAHREPGLPRPFPLLPHHQDGGALYPSAPLENGAKLCGTAKPLLFRKESSPHYARAPRLDRKPFPSFSSPPL